MAGNYDGKRKHKRKEPTWCPDTSEVAKSVGVLVKMNKKYRCPTCGRRLMLTLRNVHCYDYDCVENNTHAHFPRHKRKQ